MSEYSECKTFWEWLWLVPAVRPYLKDNLIFHVANERKTSVQAGVRLKAIGVTAGISDYIFLVPRGKFHGMVLEFKASGRPPSSVSKPQKAFLSAANGVGYKAEVAYGVDHAIEIVESYFGL